MTRATSPAPSPPPADAGLDAAAVLGVEVVLALALVVGVVALVVFALLRSARYEPRGMVVVAVSMLTAIALVAAVVTRSDAVAQLAAVGLGALAGAVSEVFTNRRRDAGPDTPNGPAG